MSERPKPENGWRDRRSGNDRRNPAWRWGSARYERRKVGGKQGDPARGWKLREGQRRNLMRPRRQADRDDEWVVNQSAFTR